VANDLDQLRQALDDLAKNFPQADTYQTEGARAYASRVLDLARLANGALIDAVGNVSNIFYKEQLDPLPTALWRDVDPVLNARLGPIRQAQKAHLETVALPAFKDVLTKALLRIQATFNQLDQLNAIKPWWAKNSKEALGALTDLYALEKVLIPGVGFEAGKAAIDGAKKAIGAFDKLGAFLDAVIHALPWIGAGLLSVFVLAWLAGHRREERR
jgi:hypothetical protein